MPRSHSCHRLTRRICSPLDMRGSKLQVLGAFLWAATVGNKAQEETVAMKFHRWLLIGTLVVPAMSSLACGPARESFDGDSPREVAVASSALNQGLFSSNEPFL